MYIPKPLLPHVGYKIQNKCLPHVLLNYILINKKEERLGAIMGVTITFEAHLPIKIKKKGKWFIACCEVLDVITQGESKIKAKENLEEAVGELIATCYEMGTLDEVLKESGFTLVKPHKKSKPTKDELSVKVPLYLLEKHHGHKFCQA